MRRIPLTAVALCLIAATISCTALSATPKAVDSEVDRILGKLKRASAADVWSAERQLVALGADAVPILKDRLPKARPGAQVAAAKALCDLGHPDGVVEPLVGLVRSKHSGDYASMAAVILGTGARDVPATERHLAKLVDEESLPGPVSREIARALWSAATTEESLKQANAALRRHLAAAKDPATRRQCALALAQIDDFNAPVDAILKELQDQPTPEGRLARALLETNNLRSLLIRPKNREGDLNDRFLNEIKQLMQRFHVEEPRPDHELVNAAAKGMVGALQQGDDPDRHSAYFDEKDWQKFREHISGHYGGIGAVVQFIKHFDAGDLPVFSIVRPNYSGPAYKVGLRSYDRILEVNGKSTAIQDAKDIEKKLKEIVDNLRGKPDREAEIVVTSPGSKERRKLKVKKKTSAE